MRHQRTAAHAAASIAVAVVLTGCATAPLTDTGALLSHAELKPSDGDLTRTKQKADKRSLLAAKSVYLVPTTLTEAAQRGPIKPEQAALVANAIDRTLCSGLSRRFTVSSTEQTADVTVRVVITHLGATDTTLAGTSAVLGIGGKVAGAASGVPIPVPRLPFGLGSLSVEGSADTRSGQKIGALAWARGADFLTTQARASEEGDAYALAAAFADDFAYLLVTGNDPIADPTSSMPSIQSAGEYFGADPKHAACARFGKNPGIGGTIGGAIGLPPSWTDKGTGSARLSP
ncbi:MAG: DUF3313 family protein [Gammaproteobacteria bacterium]|nr:DUF3313 family protein [Gammaproteobacteria bacterium]